MQGNFHLLITPSSSLLPLPMATPVATQIVLSSIFKIVLCVSILLHWFSKFSFQWNLIPMPNMQNRKVEAPKVSLAHFRNGCFISFKTSPMMCELFTIIFILTGPWRTFITCSRPQSSKIMELKLHLFSHYKLSAYFLCVGYNCWHLGYISEQIGRVSCPWWRLYSTLVDLNAGLFNSKMVWT